MMSISENKDQYAGINKIKKKNPVFGEFVGENIIAL